MRSVRLFFALAFIAAFSVTVEAQLCGSFGVTLHVMDRDQNPVLNHLVKIEPLGKDELRGKKFEPLSDPAGTSELKLSEGHEVSGQYRVTVSAPGFQDAKKIITFPHCVWLSYDIVLFKYEQPRTLVEGSLVNEKGEAVPYARLTFIAADKTERAVNADFAGKYEIRLTSGVYIVEAKLMYHHITRVEGLIVPANGQKRLDVPMQRQSYDQEKRTITLDPPKEIR